VPVVAPRQPADPQENQRKRIETPVDKANKAKAAETSDSTVLTKNLLDTA
jgi:hypothetical protein